MNALTDSSFFKILKEKFPHDPTPKQSVALQQLSSYVLSKE
jgi:exodeoxyribonuclease-5